MPDTSEHLTVVNHPLVQHKLALIRDRDTESASFRDVLREISLLLAYEVCRDMDVETIKVNTPLESTTGSAIDDGKLCL